MQAEPDRNCQQSIQINGQPAACITMHSAFWSQAQQTSPVLGTHTALRSSPKAGTCDEAESGHIPHGTLLVHEVIDVLPQLIAYKTVTQHNFKGCPAWEL